MTNMNLLFRFNKIRDLFPSVTRVLSILLTKAATGGIVDRADFKRRVVQSLTTFARKPKVPSSSAASSYAQR